MKKIPRRLLSLILCVCMIGTLIPTVFAANKPEFSVSIEYENGNSEETFGVNDTVTAHIMVQRTDSEESFDLYSLFLETTFDTNYLTPVSYKSDLASKIMIHSPLDISGSANYKQARITYHELGVAIPCSNKVEVATLTFTAKTETPVAGSIMSFFDGAKVEGKQGEVYTLQYADYHRGIVHIGSIPATAYPVTYDLNGAAGTAPTEADHTKDSTFRLAFAPTREHYKFLGWNDGTNTLSADAEYTMPDHAVTFKAQWEQMDFKVHYEANGATSGTAPADEWKAKTTSVNVQTSDLKKTDYTFDGWLCSFDNTVHPAGYTFTMPAADVTITAQWKPKDNTGGSSGGGGGGGSVSATYPINIIAPSGGTASSNKKTAASGETVTITVTPPTGSTIDSVTAADRNGKSITVSGGNGKYTFKMPASAVTVTVKYKKNNIDIVGDCPKDNTCPIDPFTDTENTKWWHDGIHYCLANGLMKGVSTNRFSPNGTTTRAMIVTILWRMENSPAASASMSFKDVPSGQWYTEAIRWAQSTGVVTGYNADTFGPNDNITREQLAAILYRYADSHKLDVTARSSLSQFTDAADISSWALENIKWANAAGLVSGRTAVQFAPKANATRAEAASMIQRFCENILHGQK